MPAFELHVRIPFGDAGHVALDIDIADLAGLSPEQRRVLADTGREFADLATATLEAGCVAEVHDPNTQVLAGVTGSRANTS